MTAPVAPPPPAPNQPQQPYRTTVRYGRRLAALWALGASAGVVVLVTLLMGPAFPFLMLGVGACLGAGLGAPLFWSLLAPNGRTFRVWGGLLAGLLATLLAHLTLWLGLLAPVFVSEVELADYPNELLGLLAGVLTLGWASLFAVGPVTLPAGAIAGVLVTLQCRRRLARAAAQEAPPQGS